MEHVGRIALKVEIDDLLCVVFSSVEAPSTLGIFWNGLPVIS